MEKVITGQFLRPGEERQALHLAKWMEARRNEAQSELVSPTESKEKAEITLLLKRMDLVGIPVTIAVVNAIIVLLVHNFGLWIVTEIALLLVLSLLSIGRNCSTVSSLLKRGVRSWLTRC